MATSIGLNFRLTAAVDKFESSMKDVETRLKSIEHHSKQTAGGMKLIAALEVGKAVLSGLSTLFNIFQSGVSSVVDFANEARAAQDAVGKLSSATGMAHEPLQIFTAIAGYSGVSADQFGSALQKMSKSLGEASMGTGEAKGALETLGLSIDSLMGLSPAQQFTKIAAALDSIEDPAKKSALAADIFGKSGTALIPMFKDIESNVKATADEMLSLGQILSGTQIKNIEAMNDSFDKIKKTAFQIGSQIIANFAPALENANNALLQMIKDFEYEGSTGGQGLANFLTKQLFAFAKVMAEGFDNFLNGYLTAVEYFLKGLAFLMDGLAIVMSPFLSLETEVSIQDAASQIDHFANTVGKIDVNMTSFVDGALDKFNLNTNLAAENTKKFTASIGPAGTSFEAFSSEVLSRSSQVKQPLEGLAEAATEASEAAVSTWTPLDGIKTYGSLAVGKLGELVVGLANSASSNKLTADEVARLGAAANAAAKALPEPPKVMEMTAQQYAEFFGATEQQQQALLDMMKESSDKAFKQETINNYMNQWQQQADALMSMYMQNGVASEQQLKQQMALEKQAFQNKLQAMSQHSTGWMELQAQQTKAALDAWSNSDALGGDNGIFTETTGPDLPMNEDPGGPFDGLEVELSSQTAKLTAIETNTANFQLQPATIG